MEVTYISEGTWKHIAESGEDVTWGASSLYWAEAIQHCLAWWPQNFCIFIRGKISTFLCKLFGIENKHSKNFLLCKLENLPSDPKLSMKYQFTTCDPLFLIYPICHTLSEWFFSLPFFLNDLKKKKRHRDTQGIKLIIKPWLCPIFKSSASQYSALRSKSLSWAINLPNILTNNKEDQVREHR